MNSYTTKKTIYKKIRLVLLVSFLSLLLNTFPVYAVTETIQYDYDNAREITKVTYDDGTDVEYAYDSSGNRLAKTTTFVGSPANNPPSTPSNLSPTDTSAGLERIVNISWTASSDPDAGDLVVYDIYLGTTSPPPLYSSGLNATNYTTLLLQSEITYYWRINARDNHNAISEGSIWSFSTGADTDDDGLIDIKDNCPTTYNPDQIDTDNDGSGNDCDSDDDGDGIDDTIDNCPLVSNVGQEDLDNDGLGNVCDSDDDGDGIDDTIDNCPLVSNLGQEDLDGDNIGDVCDDDIDGDGYDNDVDVCPILYDDQNQADADGDGYGDACTIDHCVTTSSELQAALDTAETNAMDNVVKLEQGTYGVSGNNNNNFLYYPNLAQYNRLVIRGGYTAGCVSRNPDPSNTILDGEGISDVLTLNDLNTSHYPRHMLVESVTIQNGNRGVDAYSTYKDFMLRNSIIRNNVYGVDTSTTNGKTTLLNNLIQSNSASYYAGVKSLTSTGEIEIANNVISGNTADDYGGGIYAYVYGEGGTVKLINNTITENEVTKTSGYGGGVYLYMDNALSTADIYNNIFWNNSAQSSGGDIYIHSSSTGAVNAYNNNFDPAKVYGIFTSEGNNINIDPQFVDAANGDYHLSSGSPCIDEGSNTAPSLPTTDYEGDGRVFDGDGDTVATTDIGADEYIVCLSPVRIASATPVYYSTLQEAYDAAVDGNTIQTQAVVFTEDLIIGRNISVTLEGGYDCSYATITGQTTLNGNMTISDGTATIENVVLE